MAVLGYTLWKITLSTRSLPQPLPLYFVLPIGYMQPVLLRQIATDSYAATTVIAVADGAPVVVYAVGNNYVYADVRYQYETNYVLRVHNPLRCIYSRAILAIKPSDNRVLFSIAKFSEI